MLRIEFAELEGLGFDLELTGFGLDEIGALDFDEPPYPEHEPESSTQEIDPDDYQMGNTCPKCGFEFDDE